MLNTITPQSSSRTHKYFCYFWFFINVSFFVANVSEKWAIFQFTFCNKYIFMQNRFICVGLLVFFFRVPFEISIFVQVLLIEICHFLYLFWHRNHHNFSVFVSFENASVECFFFGLVIQKNTIHFIDTVSILPELNNFDHYFKWPRPDQMPLPIQNNKFNYFHIINLKMEKSL